MPLWVSGEQLRAMFEGVVLAEYHCHYDWRTHKITGIRDRVFYPARFASPQSTLLSLNPYEAMVVYHPELDGGRCASPRLSSCCCSS